MRRDQQRLEDILEAIDSLARIVSGKHYGDLRNDEALRFAVVQRLTVMGEAASRLSATLREQHDSVPWTDIIGFRNILVHEYFGLLWSVVWETAISDAPALRRQILAILASEFPD